MNPQILIVLCLTFIIHLITTLAYSVRIVGSRTGKIVIAFSLFNILVLVARAAQSLQAPLLAKHLERQLENGPELGLAADFRLILLAATAATALGILLMPTFQRFFIKVVEAFNLYRSVPRLLLHGFSKTGVHHLKTSVAIPITPNPGNWRAIWNFPLLIIFLNTLVEAIFTVGVLAALYAGYLNPALRVTASSLSAMITGGATVLLFVFIDPYLSMLTDDVMQGKVSHPFFRHTIALLLGGRLVGTVLAQLLLVPAASMIASIARLL